MSGPVWRAILWAERFLPVPRPLTAEAARAAEARGRAAFVPMLVFPMIVTLLRERHALGEILRHDHVVLAQMMLIVAGGIVAAMIAFGAKAWRDAKDAR